MKLKQFVAASLSAAMILTAVPVGLGSVLPSSSIVSTAYAAKGGAKMSIPSAPKAPAAAPKANTAPSAGSESKSVSGNGANYAPSKDAKSLSPTAPNANAKTNAAAGTQAQSSSRFGSIMRNIGLFAGGMFLGSMLASLFGGSGLMADILGALANVAMIFVAIMVLRWIWNKFRGNKNNDPYHQNQSYNSTRNTDSYQSAQTRPIDITPRDSHPGTDYDAKSTADRYRNR